MRTRLLVPAAALLLALAAPAAAGAADVAPSHVIVGFDRWTTRSDRLAVERVTGTRFAVALPGGARQLRIKDGESVWKTLVELRAQPGVRYAVPDHRIHAAAYFPNDPGRGGAGNWRQLQWNFAGPFGVRAPLAWETMRQLHVDGGRGVTVAVIDSGVAYTDRGTRFRRAPDLSKDRFVKGHDFIDGDSYPLDEDNHGTHVTGTIAEQVNNKRAVTGLAYGVRIMPLRVLDAQGGGDGATLARAIRWATQHGARVINMSVEFDIDLRAADIPDVIAAIRDAHNHNVVMVGAAGNDGESRVSYPARGPDVIAVGATTSSGCQADYSNYGSGLDVTAPGGGADLALTGSAWDRAHCGAPGSGRAVFQQTFVNNPRDFHLIGFEGTSESAPHVTALAALVIASGRLGPNPTADAVAARIESRARDVGPPGYDSHYGYGLVDAAAAVAP